MNLTIPLVCQTCDAAMNPESIESIEYMDDELIDVCPCCGDIGATFLPEA